MVLGHASPTAIGALVTGKVASITGSALVVTMSASAAALTMTGAVFSDSDSVGSNAFDTGTVILSTSPTSAVVSFSSMAPGDEVVAPLTVSNNGSLQLRYAITNQTTEHTLAAQLDMTIKTGVTTSLSLHFLYLATLQVQFRFHRYYDRWRTLAVAIRETGGCGPGVGDVRHRL